MKKTGMFVIALGLIVAGMSQTKSIHDFTVKDIEGNDFSFASLKGKKAMIVNTASECGLTPQYEGLENLYLKYGGYDFVIIGFPANNFMGQEPGTDEQIAAFCEKNYGVTFPMMSKISVKGDDQHELYAWLTQKSLNGYKDSKVKWNFQKYLINPNGTIAAIIAPRTKPESQEIIDWIKE